MEELIYRINLNFEEELYNKPKGQDYSSELEYIVFLLNKDPKLKISTQNKYSAYYLKRLKSLGFTLPELTEQRHNCNWWGDLEGVHAHKFNSKVFSTTIKIDELSYNDSFVINSREELCEKISFFDSKVLLKPVDSFSARGFRLIQDKKNIPKDLKFPLILEPFRKRVIDFSVQYRNKEFYISEIINNSKGAFKGVLIRDFNFNKFEPEIKRVSQLIAEKCNQNLSIDMFLYRDQDKVYLNPLCEINTRHSMGELSRVFSFYKPEAGIGVWLLLTKKELLKNVDTYNSDNKTGVFFTSEEQMRFQSIFLAETNISALKKLLKEYISEKYLEELDLFEKLSFQN